MNNKTAILYGAILNNHVKNIKKRVTGSCTFLAPYTAIDGEVYLKAVINKKPTYLSLPQDFQLRAADIDRIVELINSKSHVTEGDEVNL
jgi:TPP-dependent 2-oxoacid decarboxylase